MNYVLLAVQPTCHCHTIKQEKCPHRETKIPVVEKKKNYKDCAQSDTLTFAPHPAKYKRCFLALVCGTLLGSG